MRVVILGGSIAGLTSALLLARSGHDVMVLERDDLRTPIGPDEAMTLPRAGVPQFLQGHGFLARARKLLIERCPDVYEEFLRLGAEEINAAKKIPGERQPGDDELKWLAIRRPTIELGLRRIVAREARISLRSGVRVEGLIRRDSMTGGARTVDSEIECDLLVDAMGRSSRLPDWLKAEGFEVPQEESSECGLLYYTRYFRFKPGREFPDGPWPIAPMGEFAWGGWNVFWGDNRTFGLFIGHGPWDRELRIVRHNEAFQAILAALPIASELTSPEFAEPITSVSPMGNLRNMMRSYVVDGASVVRGVVAIGDALCHTDPFFGHGMSLAIGHAAALADALEEEGKGEIELSYYERVTPLNEERYRWISAMDASRTRRMRGGSIDYAAAENRSFSIFSKFIRASFLDPEVMRRGLRVIGVLDPVANIEDDPVFLNRIDELFKMMRASQPTGAPVSSFSREAVLEVARSALPESPR